MEEVFFAGGHIWILQKGQARYRNIWFRSPVDSTYEYERMRRMDLYEIRTALHAGKTIYDLPLRVTYYARVSTDKDEQLHSLSAQVSYYEGYIRENPNWVFVEGYVDEGLSGTSVKKREQFLRMIHDAHTGTFDFIITKEISRFSRNTLDSIRYTQDLLRCGVGVLFQSDSINTLMPDAELRLTIMSSIAQDEVRKTSERVKFGFRRAIEKGVVLGSNRIWGYEKDRGKLVIKEDEAEIVRLIFDLYGNHRMGIRGISRHLTECGYRNTNGNDFSFSTIRGILCNPKYKGFYCGRKTTKIDYKLSAVKEFAPEEWVVYQDEESVPPIVSKELWEKANHILAERSAKQGAEDSSGYRNQYPYSGKIVCGIHKKPYYHSLYRYKTEEREVWQCREYVRSGKNGCRAPKLYAIEADEIVSQIMDETALSRTAVGQELLDLYLSIGCGRKNEGERGRWEEQIKEIFRRKDKLLDLSVEGRISDQEFSVRNERFNRELEVLRRKILELDDKKREAPGWMQSLECIEKAIEKELMFPAGYSGGVLEELIERMEVYGTADRNQIRVIVYLIRQYEPVEYRIERHRGKPSVCSRVYT